MTPNTLTRLLLVAGCLALPVMAQQPNSLQASLIIGGTDGPPWPILKNVRTSTVTTLAVGGAVNQPFAVFQAVNTQLNSVSAFGDKCDLQLTPFPVAVMNGFVNPGYNLGPQGAFNLNITVPNAGNPPNGIPLGASAALQALIGDPTHVSGLSLSAATKVTVVQGPTVVNLQLGDESAQLITLSGLQMPFFGINYSSIGVCSNGYLTMGTTTVEYTGSTSAFHSGPPRIAGFWCDLDQSSGSIKYTVDTNPGPGLTPYFQVDFTNVLDYANSVVHSFGMYIDTSGMVKLIHPINNNPSVYDCIVGIGPGNNVNSAAIKDLSTMCAPSPGVLGAFHENFHEWFGITGPAMPFYAPVPFQTRIYDMYGRTPTFIPAWTGNLPGATDAYYLY